MAIMESVYVMTGRVVWRKATLFWGVLFGINFAMGVATGVVMEFQFGMNWSYYSHYVGDVFGAPLAMEGLMAFFLEATLVGLFFFGWDRLKPVTHLAVTWLVALGANFSALWILIANGWMQNPVGAAFNPDTMRMEVTDFMAVLFNPVAQAKFVHTVSAGYVCGSIFVLAISAIYLLSGKHIELAKRLDGRWRPASASPRRCRWSCSVTSRAMSRPRHQKMKIAAMEAMYETEPPPASFAVFGFPDVAERTTHFAIHIPWVMGIIGTRSLDGVLPGINELVDEAAQRIEHGRVAYTAMQTLRRGPGNAQARAAFDANKQEASAMRCCSSARWLIRRRRAELMCSARRRAPFPMCRCCSGRSASWSVAACISSRYSPGRCWLASQRRLDSSRRYLKIALWSLPLPGYAIELRAGDRRRRCRASTWRSTCSTASAYCSLPPAGPSFSLPGFLVFFYPASR